MLSFDVDLNINFNFDGELNNEWSFDGDLKDTNGYDCDLAISNIVSAEEHETYFGEIQITPQINKTITLNTDDKIVEDDIVVLPIPYFEVSNTSGTTIIIGG